MGCGMSSEKAVRRDSQSHMYQPPNVVQGVPQQHIPQAAHVMYAPAALPSQAALALPTGNDMSINRPIAVRTWIKNWQMAEVEEEKFWAELEKAGHNTWASLHAAFPSDSADNVAALIQACPASDKPGLAHALITKAAMEVAAARQATSNGAPPSPVGPVTMAPAHNGYQQMPAGQAQHAWIQTGGYPVQAVPQQVPVQQWSQPAPVPVATTTRPARSGMGTGTAVATGFLVGRMAGRRAQRRAFVAGTRAGNRRC
eukprot:jgi/Botrbrau1/10310/Bobra.0120s0023.1